MAENTTSTFVTIVKGMQKVSKNDTRAIREDSFKKLFGGKTTLKNMQVVKLTDDQVEYLENGGSIDVAELTATGEVSKALQENKLLKADKEAQEKALAEKAEENAKLKALLDELQAKAESGKPSGKKAKAESGDQE